MGKRTSIKTTIAEAADYWSRHVDECGLSVDWAEAHTHCWRCGCKKNLQRCHIVPDSLDGPDTPSNIVLLCKRCHADGPNVTDPKIMWDWIRAYGVPFYEMFWNILGVKEYEFIYKKSVIAKMKDIFSAVGATTENDMEAITAKFEKILRNVMQEAGFHFGQPYLNTATIAGVYRMSLKKLAEQCGTMFHSPLSPADEQETVWWM